MRIKHFVVISIFFFTFVKKIHANIFFTNYNNIYSYKINFFLLHNKKYNKQNYLIYGNLIRNKSYLLEIFGKYKYCLFYNNKYLYQYNQIINNILLKKISTYNSFYKNNFFFSLKKLKTVFVIKKIKKKKKICYVLIPKKDKSYPFKKIIIELRKKYVINIHVLNICNKYNIFFIKNININLKLKNTLFYYKAPFQTNIFDYIS